MAFTLYIWGPAFGLPSIDAECIAATTYLNQLLPQDQWALVTAYDPLHSPNGDFPFLQHESESVAGFAAIVEYLAYQGYSLDGDLSLQQRAAGTAIRAHLVSNALPLLDATLYTSSANYTAATRPAWTKILPAQANFIVPPRRHDAAKSRTLPLGLSTGSVDDLPPSDFSPQQEQEARMLSSSPSLLFKKRQTLQDALKAQQTRTVFRLESLTDALMEPFGRILNGKKYLLSSAKAGPSSIDCLAFGYLALVLFPDMPNTWVAETIRKSFKHVADYVDALRDQLLPDGPVDVDAVMLSPPLESNSQRTPSPPRRTTSFPWRTTTPATSTSIFKSISTSLFSSLVSPLQQHFLLDSSVLVNSPPTFLRSWTSPLILFLTLSAPVFAALSFVLYNQTHLDPEPNKRFGRPLPQLRSLGQAGNVLSFLGSTEPRVPSIPRHVSYGNTTSAPPGPARGGGIASDQGSAYDGEEKQRRDQDRPAFSEKPGVSVEIGIAQDPEGGGEADK